MRTITIVFRGLMVFNQQSDRMEIGFVDALHKPNGGPPHGDVGDEHGQHHSPAHIPRILTMKEGVIASIFDLRTRKDDLLGKVRNWELVVTQPHGDVAVTVRQQGDQFLRTEHDFAQDFRWITDLEADDLHGRPLSPEINTRQLLMVLYVKHGDFYTRLKSPVLRKVIDGDQEAYGANAAVVGCDIAIEDGGGVALVAGGAGGVGVFEFSSDEGTLYEISNGPPDVPAEDATPMDAPGHFHMYYDKLFNKEPDDKFDLIKDEDGAPAPDPALCGATILGLREDPL